ncbi:MAG: hypothetical protein F4103_15360 [Boseongicola sp. SB0673_bin_14]|nr:hypothetical protein [Boseongicola sp. SB0673_bin_14]
MRIDTLPGIPEKARTGTGGRAMRVRIRTRVHTAETIINIEREVLSLRAAKRLFRALQSAVPDNDLEMIVVRARREKNGIEVGHRIDRTNMH